MKNIGIALLLCCLLPFVNVQQEYTTATSAEVNLVAVSSVEHTEESDDILLNEAISLAQQVDAMARSEEWMQLLGGGDTLLEAARSFAGNRETPEAVYRLVLTDDDVAQILAQLTDGQVPQLDEALMAQLSNRILNGSVSQMNAAAGVEALAAANCLQATSVFAGDVENPVVYLLTYADASPILVVFQGERGAVQAVASPLHSSLDVASMMDMLPLEKVQ